MRSITEPERKVPVTCKTDVLVVGGGSAGFAAALASSRTGAKTMLIERYGCLGGMMTGGLVTTIPKVDDGINGELISRLEAVDAVATHEKFLAIDPELTKWILDDMLQNANVSLLFYTFAASVIVHKGAIKAVIIENKSGRQAIEAKVYIDTTGDGDIAAYSGCPFVIEDEKGSMYPITSMFLIQNVAKSAPEKYFKPAPGLFADAFMGKDSMLHQGEKYCWPGNIWGVDGLDQEKLTQTEIYVRRRACEWIIQARKNIPGCENAFISQVASQVGVRETRLIIGLYTLKRQDWKDNIKFKDTIGLTYGKKIPFSCLIPKKIGNLLVAGRCISYERDLLNPMRGITICITTGQATGVAAALACRDNVAFDDLDIETLRRVLRKQGVEF